MSGGGRNQTTVEARVERWLTEPDTEQSVGARFARRMVIDGVGNIGQIAAEWGCSKASIYSAIYSMRLAGYPVQTDKTGAVTLGTQGPAAVAQRSAQPYPALGQQLMVKALALSDHGDIILMLSDGNGAAWQATVTGST